MSTPCGACGAVISECDDASLGEAYYYSLTGPTGLGFVINCPPGADCLAQRTIYYGCCGHLLSAQVPVNATADVVFQVWLGLLRQCAPLIGPCQTFLPDAGGNAIVPGAIFFNKATSCTVSCPIGTKLVWTIPPGIFVGSSQSSVDALAQAFCSKMAIPHCPTHAGPPTPLNFCNLSPYKVSVRYVNCLYGQDNYPYGGGADCPPSACIGDTLPPGLPGAMPPLFCDPANLQWYTSFDHQWHAMFNVGNVLTGSWCFPPDGSQPYLVSP